MMAAQLTLGKDSIVVGGVQKLFPGALMIAGAYDVFPDGQKFLLVEPAQCPFVRAHFGAELAGFPPQVERQRANLIYPQAFRSRQL